MRFLLDQKVRNVMWFDIQGVDLETINDWENRKDTTSILLSTGTPIETIYNFDVTFELLKENLYQDILLNLVHIICWFIILLLVIVTKKLRSNRRI